MHRTALVLVVLGANLAACASGDDDRGQGAIATTPTTTLSTTTTVPPAMPSPLGAGVMSGASMSSEQYAKGVDIQRDGVPYYFMANGWGPGFASQSVEWNGTSFTVLSMMGQQGEQYQPASYPTVFCGRYSSNNSPSGCGLPAAFATLTQLRTGWSWDANGNTGEYNAAYDVWLSDDNGQFTSFFMVWLRDPIGQQPAGSGTDYNISVANIPGVWDIWVGEVHGAPITNYVAHEDADVPAIEFDMLDFFRDAAARGINVPGTQVMGVAVGFEIWNGPVTNLKSLDFYVDAR